MQVVDEPRVVMNDGAVGVFDVTLWDEERGRNAYARVSYNLRLDLELIPPNLHPKVIEAILRDTDLKDEMREIVSARRDALREMN